MMASALVQLNNTFNRRLIAQPIVKIRPNQINVCAQDLTLSRVILFYILSYAHLLRYAMREILLLDQNVSSLLLCTVECKLNPSLYYVAEFVNLLSLAKEGCEF